MKLFSILTRNAGKNDWRRIESKILIQEPFCTIKNQIFLSSQVKYEFNLHIPSILSLIDTFEDTILNAIHNFNSEVLSTLQEQEIQILNENIPKDLDDLYNRIQGFDEPELNLYEEEITEIKNDLLIDGEMLKIECKITLSNESISFSSNINSIFVLIDHFLRHILDISTKLDNEQLKCISISKFLQIKDKFDQIKVEKANLDSKYAEENSTE